MLGKGTIEQANKYCCQNISLIENYEEAIINEKRYCCHHKNGLNVSKEELIEKGLYYNRPANELIFLEIGEHIKLHNKGEKNPMFGRKGENAPMFGRNGEKNPMFGRKGKNAPHKKECTINGITYGCLKDAHKALYPNILYDTFCKKYREGKL